MFYYISAYNAVHIVKLPWYRFPHLSTTIEGQEGRLMLITVKAIADRGVLIIGHNLLDIGQLIEGAVTLYHTKYHSVLFLIYFRYFFLLLWNS